MSLPYIAVLSSEEAPAKKPSGFRKWIPTLGALALVAAAGISAQVDPSNFQGRHLAVKAHHDAVFNTPAAAAAEGTNWFNDNKAPIQPRSEIARRPWGTARAYPPPVTEGARGRELYETHVDVSDQFTTFGKVSVGLMYFAWWVFLMFPNWFLPIGRPGIALSGGMASIIYRYILESTGQGPAFNAEGVLIWEPLYLLFGLMLTTVYLEKMERGGLFDKIRDSLDDPIPWRRSCKIMTMSTIGSAAVMNDSIVLIFSGVVVDLCVRHKVANSTPYLLSLATTANIGSALTMTGNPQNILIVSLAYDDIGWIEFASNMILPVIAATTINSTMMMVYYRDELFPGSTGIADAYRMMITGAKTPEMLSLERTYFARKAANPSPINSEGWTLWSKIQVLVVIGFLAFFALGFDVSCVCISAGISLMVCNAWKRRDFDPPPVNLDEQGNPVAPKKVFDTDGNEIVQEVELITESETTLTEVDYGLLLLFMGQFLLIGNFDDTGIPQAFFAITMGGCADQMATVPCVYWFVMIVTLLSNIASNVPICQMLAATFPYATPYEWIQVSFSATIAGNLTMLGSAANMIVAFQSAKVGDRTFTSERHAPFGIPSTLLCLYAGTAILTVFSVSPKCSENLGEC
jgi:Na+/H+ antiporter NhaD/arsenite permease-like protein